MMKWMFSSLSLTVLLGATVVAQGTDHPKAKVSFEDFKGLAAEVEAHRANRLVDLDTFLKMSREPGTVIFDSRSDFRFDRIHVKGARHLAFTDFTQGNLAKVFPSFATRILIYCNNNFDGNQTDFASKVALPFPRPDNAIAARQFAAQEKPLMMALNIPTYINLYGYGYRNVYELNELVKVTDPRIAFEGSIVARQPVPAAATGRGSAGSTEGDGDSTAARPLSFKPSQDDFYIRFGGKGDVTTMEDVEAIGRLVGEGAARQLCGQVDFSKEKVVLVSWTTAGPPEGKLAHETKTNRNGPQLVFYVQGPAGAKFRGMRARIAADFFALPKGVDVTFDPAER